MAENTTIIQKTIDQIKELLSQFSGYKDATVEEATPEKIVLRLNIAGLNEQEVLKNLLSFVKQHPTGYPAVKDSKLTFNTLVPGFELGIKVECKVELAGAIDEFVQNFTSCPPEKQALLKGLVAASLSEEKPEQVLKRLHIKYPKLEANQELEFALSEDGLVLSKVTVKDFEGTEGKVVWKSQNWEDLKKLLKGYSIDSDFDTLLGEAEKNLNVGSKRKVLSYLKDASEYVVEKAADKLTNGIPDDREPKYVVALYGGSFRPPHKGHFNNAVKLCKGADRLLIFISPKDKENIPVTAEQAKKVWEIYSRYIDIPVEVRISPETTVQSIEKLVGNPELAQYKFVLGNTPIKEDKQKYQALKQQYPNLELVKVPVDTTVEDRKLEATTLEKSAELLRKDNWMPKELDRDDARKVLNTVLKPIGEDILKEGVNKAIQKALETLKEGSSGTHIAFTSVTSSENREKLRKLYEILESQYGNQFSINFNQSFIQIKVKWPGELQSGRNGFDYEMSQAEQFNEGQEQELNDPDKAYWTKNMAGLIKYMEGRGVGLQPLPEIILKKEPQQDGLLDKTGSYDKDSKIIELYTAGRHPKDIGRSLAHELIHHAQNLEGRLVGFDGDRISDDENLKKLEEEATLKGYTLFREYTESLRK